MNNNNQKNNLFPGYEMLDVLGTGARSTIYSARDLQTGELVAIKRVVREKPEDGRFIEQALNEFKISRQVTHPVLRRCLKIKRDRWLFLTTELRIVMDYFDGTELAKRVPKTYLEQVNVFRKVAAGLRAMHEAHLVHADIKPNNILLGEKGKVQIIDFGQACPIGFIKKRIQGTPDFIAPEQVRRERLDQRTDVFNLGATIYWVLTGRAIPTDIPNKKNRIQLQQERLIRPPIQINPETPPALSKLVEDCCRRRPQKRPHNMNEVRGRLDIIAQSLSMAEN